MLLRITFAKVGTHLDACRRGRQQLNGEELNEVFLAKQHNISTFTDQTNKQTGNFLKISGYYRHCVFREDTISFIE